MTMVTLIKETFNKGGFLTVPGGEHCREEHGGVQADMCWLRRDQKTQEVDCDTERS